MKLAVPATLTAAALITPFLATPLTAQAQNQTFKGGTYTDNTLGFKVKVPTKWRRIPTKPDEQWVVALFQSDKEYISRDGWSKKLLMRVIMFDKNAPAKARKEDKASGVIRFGRNLLYRDFTDYVKRTQGGGGFFFSKEQERKGKTPGMIYEVKFEKLAHAKRRIVAWDYKRQDMSFAIEFDIYEEHYKKLKSTMNRAFKSFRFIEVQAANASGNANKTGPVEIPSGSEWKKLSPIERHKRRLALEEEQAKKLLSKLPKDWKVTKRKHFLVISHADPKFTKSVVDLGEACWGWLDKRFGKISDEYVRRCILRIYKDEDEYRAYHSGGTGGGLGFTISFGSFQREVTEIQFYKGELVRDQANYFMRKLFSHYLSDKDDDLMRDVPDWVSSGIGGMLNGTVVKGRKVTFEPSINERVAFSKLIRDGGFKEGKLKTVKELMHMTGVQQQELEVKKGSAYYQMARLMRFLEGPGKKLKLFGGKDFLIEYCRAAGKAEDQYRKKNPRKSESGYREARTEEEEERRAAEAEARSRKNSAARAAEERGILDLLNSQALKFSDQDWEQLQKAYAKYAKKK